jgi:hypothetical protein
VADPDVSDRVVELARLARLAQPLRFMPGDSTGLDHLPEPAHETLSLLWAGLVLMAFIHSRKLSRQSVAVKSERISRMRRVHYAGAEAVD